MSLGVAAESVLTRVASAVAVRTLGAHADAQQTGEHDTNIHSEWVDRTQRVSRQDELARLVAWLFTASAVVMRFERGLVFADPFFLLLCMFYLK